jgi:hypothetical protein
VTTKLTSGIATALANGDTTDTCWNSAIVIGTSATVTASCTCAAARSRVRQSVSGGRRPRITSRIAATAPNDSQKPGAALDHGSISVTTAAASASVSDGRSGTRASKATATTDSMKKVRCAGTPQPASRQYSSAAVMPVTAAAVCAGARASSARERRHSTAASQAASPPIIVMCRPLMETRCEMPVALNSSQSASPMARWSPSTSAISTPA